MILTNKREYFLRAVIYSIVMLLCDLLFSFHRLAEKISRPTVSQSHLFTIHYWDGYQYAKDSGNLGRNSNGKVCFGFFGPEYSGSPLQVMHMFRLEYYRLKFAVPFLTNWFFALIREFGKRS